MRKPTVTIFLILAFCLILSSCSRYFEGYPTPQAEQEDVESSLSAKSKIQYIINNKDLYPDRLIESLKHNPELVDFAFDYPEKKGTYNNDIDLSKRYTKGQIPLFIQWEKDWGYASYGDGVIGLDGCGPTSLSMVYIGLTGDLSYNPKALAAFSETNGYLDTKNDITLWTLMSEGAKVLGLESKELPLDENIMIRELSNGHPIICSVGPGNFTTTGHFIVVYDYVDGHFLINDPNSLARSQQEWDYSEIESEIKNLWAFSK
ncbi:MAG: hypothetical protein GX352_04225 [Clostridiales bacterium]|nr:hypothetical protein [Clostridiales bacterium]